MPQSPIEDQRRRVYLVARAGADGIKPNEYVRRKIQSSIQHGNIFVQEGHGFVVMGYDGFDHDFSLWFGGTVEGIWK
jgi:hypothetical protein